jgi:hypothetical protein
VGGVIGADRHCGLSDAGHSAFPSDAATGSYTLNFASNRPAGPAR